MTTDGCVSSRLVPECDGEDSCGFYGLPHVLCVPIPPYAQRVGDAAKPASGEDGAAPQDALRRAAAAKASG